MGVSVPYRGLMSRKLHDVYYGNDEEFNCFSPLSGFNVSQGKDGVKYNVPRYIRFSPLSGFNVSQVFTRILMGSLMACFSPLSGFNVSQVTIFISVPVRDKEFQSPIGV